MVRFNAFACVVEIRVSIFESEMRYLKDLSSGCKLTFGMGVLTIYFFIQLCQKSEIT